MIKVETGIKMPKNKRGGSAPRNVDYPWEWMNLGQSFLFPDRVADHTARSMAYNASKRYRRKFTVRVCKDGLRCWRIK